MTNAKQQPEQIMVGKVKAELDSSCDRLDGYTQSRLNSIRHAALESSGSKPGRALLAPFGGFATACVLVLLVSVFYQDTTAPASPGIQEGQGSPLEDIDILTSTETLDFYENLEFYQWLEENEASV